MRYCFDLDDVLSLTLEQIVLEAIFFDINIFKHDRMSGLSFRELVGNDGDYFNYAKKMMWTEMEVYTFFHSAYPDFLKKCRVIESSRDVINRLFRKGNTIIILSAREIREDSDVMAITIEWLKQHDVLYDEVYVGYKDKGGFFKNHFVDCFVDDSLDNCRVACQNGVRSVFQFRCAYNRNQVNLNDYFIPRIDSLFQIDPS